MLTEVKLLGKLGQRFGRSHLLDIQTPREAVRALCVNQPEFGQHIIEAEQENIGYRVVIEGRDRPENELDYPIAAIVVIVVPAIFGSSEGWWYIIAGVALIGIGLFTGFAPLALLGAALLLRGIATLLAPKPAAEEDEKRSFFQSSTQTGQQGRPVPLCYGRFLCPGQPVSASITMDQISIIGSTVTGGAGAGAGASSGGGLIEGGTATAPRWSGGTIQSYGGQDDPPPGQNIRICIKEKGRVLSLLGTFAYILQPESTTENCMTFALGTNIEFRHQDGGYSNSTGSSIFDTKLLQYRTIPGEGEPGGWFQWQWSSLFAVVRNAYSEEGYYPADEYNYEVLSITIKNMTTGKIDEMPIPGELEV